ncbi:MAG: hypothetical protein JSU86_08380, partial [Phycisphaerales bacterium]
DQDCEDGNFCTVDLCDVTGSVTGAVGQCYEGDPPCGPGGECTEPIPPSQEPICERGRCCDLDTGLCRQFQPPDGPYGEYYANCQGPRDSWLATEYPCQQYPSGQDNECPTYASGIAPQGDLLVGVDVLWPGNAACPQTAVTRVGDDYMAELAATTDYIAITIVRFVASIRIQARPAIEFWDVSNRASPQLWFAVDEQAAPLAYPATPIFIEDTYFDGDVGKMDYAIHTLLFDPALTIPAHGVMAISIAPNFTPLGAIRWASTDVVDVGSNDDATMFVGIDTPPYGELVMDDFLGQCEGGPRDGLWCDRRDGNADCEPGGTCEDVPDVLAFEMVARADNNPEGACCIAAEGTCSIELPWVCELQGNVFQGAGRFCDVCALDPLNNTGYLPYCNNDPDCKICIGGDNEGDPCTATDPDCFPGGGECTDYGPCVHVPPACSVHACCDPDGNCVEYTDPDPCPDGWTDLLYGSSCDPSCCPQNAPYPGG